MNKKILFLLLFLFIPNNCYCSFDVDLSSKEYILYNMNDDSVILENKSNDRVQIASLTKVMSAVVILENIDNLDEEVLITKDVFKGLEGYSTAGFKAGWRVTYLDLLYGILLPSGADAVNAAVLSMGSFDDFVTLMNDKAKLLGLNDTHYDNPIGMDSSDNYSTAYDQAILLKYALNNPMFYKIFTTKKYTVSKYNLVLDSTLVKYSSNSLLDTSLLLGAKSGFTDNAGLCLASIANVNDIDYLFVNLGADYTKNRYNAIKDALNVYSYFGDNYSYRKVISDGQVFKKIKNKFGYDNTYSVYATDDIDLYLDNGIDIDELVYDYDGILEIDHHNVLGNKLGIVNVLYNDEVIYSYDVYLNDNLKYYHPGLYVILFLLLVILFIFYRLLKLKKRKRRRKRKKHH